MSDTTSNQKVDFTPLKNVLNSYDQPSYHLTLSIVDSTNSKKISIADSGKAPLSIQSLTIEAQVGPSELAKNTTNTNISMTISEPMGMNLIDTMYKAALQLNLKNLTAIPYLLEIYFHGYNATSGSIVSKIDNTSYKYYMLLNNLKSSFNNGDVVHNLQMIPYDESAFFDAYAVTTDGFSIPVDKSETLGSFLSKVKDRLNSTWLKNNGTQSIKYDFQYKDYDSTTKLPNNITSPSQLRLRLNSDSTSPSIQSDNIHFPNMSNFISMLDNVLASSDDAIQLAAPNASGNMTVIDATSTLVDVKSVVHRVQSKVTLGNYNSNTNDYDKTITYVICPYKSYRVADSTAAINKLPDTSTNIKKGNELIKSKLLRKNYDYLYTGDNTEILSLNIDLNFQWSYLIDAQGGLINSNTVTVGKEYKPLPNNNPLTDADITTALSGVSTASSSSILSTVSKSASAPLLNNIPNMTYLDTAKSVISETYQSNQSSSSTTSTPGYLPISTQVFGKSNYYRSEFLTQGDNTGSRSVYGFILNQLYVDANEGSLYNLEMTIKGDPFWLGTTSDLDNGTVTKVNSISNSASSVSSTLQSTSSSTNNNNSTLADFIYGEQCFTLNFNLPSGYDENTGSVKTTKSNYYSGLYSVLKVISNFNNGNFTQNISSVKVNGFVNSDVLNKKDSK